MSFWRLCACELGSLIDKSSAETPGHQSRGGGAGDTPADTWQPKALYPVVDILLESMILYVCACVWFMSANMHKHLCVCSWVYVCMCVSIWSLWVCRHVIRLVAFSPNSLQLPLNPPYFSLCESLERQSESYCFNHAVEKLSDRWIEGKRLKEKERKRDAPCNLSIYLPKFIYVASSLLFHKP